MVCFSSSHLQLLSTVHANRNKLIRLLRCMRNSVILTDALLEYHQRQLLTEANIHRGFYFRTKNVLIKSRLYHFSRVFAHHLMIQSAEHISTIFFHILFSYKTVITISFTICLMYKQIYTTGVVQCFGD